MSEMNNGLGNVDYSVQVSSEPFYRLHSDLNTCIKIIMKEPKIYYMYGIQHMYKII